MVLGPIIPGRPTPAKPAAKPSPTYDAFKYLTTASKPKPPSAAPVTKTGVYVPVGAYRKDGSAVSPATIAKAAEINKKIAPATPSRTTPSAPARPSLGTGSIETKTAPVTTGGGGGGGTTEAAAEKPLEVVLSQEDMDAAQAAADALRTFQENQAKMQLTQALGKIDRAAIEQYKGIAEDYAARGLARSGGKLQAEQKAMDEKSRAVAEAQTAVSDFLNELKLTGDLEQARTNLSKSQAFQDYISGRLAPAMGG